MVDGVMGITSVLLSSTYLDEFTIHLAIGRTMRAYSDQIDIPVIL